MAKRLLLRGGTAAENNVFTGVSRELTVDTTNWSLRIHDGTNAGGHTISSVGNFVNPPTSSKGQTGDKAGTWSADSNNFYYCAVNYTDGSVDIWRKMALTGGAW